MKEYAIKDVWYLSSAVVFPMILSYGLIARTLALEVTRESAEDMQQRYSWHK